MPTHIATRSLTAGGTLYTQSAEITASQEVVTQETIADSSTDSEIALAIDVSAVKSFYISSTAAVTVETNSGSAADNTLVLAANEPYIWTQNDPATFALDTDVTSIFVTNASGSAAVVTVIVLQDATP